MADNTRSTTSTLLEDIWSTQLPRAVRSWLCNVVIETTIHPAAKHKEVDEEALQVGQQLTDIAKEAGLKHVGGLRKRLREGQHTELASKVGSLSKLRNHKAHPPAWTEGIAGKVQAALGAIDAAEKVADDDHDHEQETKAKPQQATEDLLQQLHQQKQQQQSTEAQLATTVRQCAELQDKFDQLRCKVEELAAAGGQQYQQEQQQQELNNQQAAHCQQLQQLQQQLAQQQQSHEQQQAALAVHKKEATLSLVRAIADMQKKHDKLADSMSEALTKSNDAVLESIVDMQRKHAVLDDCLSESCQHLQDQLDRGGTGGGRRRR